MGDRTLVVNCTVPDTYDSAILVCKPDSEPVGPEDGMSKVIQSGTTNTEFDVSEYIGKTYEYVWYPYVITEIHDGDDATTFQQHDETEEPITAQPFDIVSITDPDSGLEKEYYVCSVDMKWVFIGYSWGNYGHYEWCIVSYLADETNGDIIDEAVCEGCTLSSLTINGVSTSINYGDSIYLTENGYDSDINIWCAYIYIYPGVWVPALSDGGCGWGPGTVMVKLSTYRYRYLGELDSDLSDGATTNPVTIDGESVTAVPYNYCNYGSNTYMFTEKSKWVLRDDNNHNVIADTSSGHDTVKQTVLEGTTFKTLKINGVKTKVNYWDYVINAGPGSNQDFVFLPPGVWVDSENIRNEFDTWETPEYESYELGWNHIVGTIEEEIDANRFYFKIFTDHNESNLLNYDFDRDDKIYYVSPMLYANNDMVFEYSGSEVKLIGDQAFDRCSQLSTIDCPECEYIEMNAFAYCNALTSISFPKCKYIGAQAFGFCSNLSNVYLPECTDIDIYAFQYCSNLTSIIIPNMDHIPEGTFGHCLSLSSINFANNCERIESGAFEHCNSLSSISFPLCKYIGDSAFPECESLSSAYLPKCEYIGNYAFYNCSSLTYIDLPKCSYIESCAFQHCNSLLSVSLPECGYVGVSTFANCTYLSSIFLPECGIIGSSAFKSCFNLSYAKFSKCHYIHNDAFYSCSSLAILDLSLVSQVPSLGYSTAFYGTKLSTTGSIYVPASLYSNFRIASNWVYYSNHIYSV